MGASAIEGRVDAVGICYDRYGVEKRRVETLTRREKAMFLIALFVGCRPVMLVGE